MIIRDKFRGTYDNEARITSYGPMWELSRREAGLPLQPGNEPAVSTPVPELRAPGAGKTPGTVDPRRARRRPHQDSEGFVTK